MLPVPDADTNANIPTLMDWIDQVRKIPQMIKDERVLFFATTATMVDQSERIFGRGELTNGGKLTYSSGPIYIYKPPFPKQPNGKGKTGKDIKGQWAPSYIAAKTLQGRGDTPFELTGDLRIAYYGGPRPSPAPVENGPLLCTIELPVDIAKRAEGLAKQKGEFLPLNDAEIRQHVIYLEQAYKEFVLDRL
jgi:hypothetical protein